MLQEYLQKLKDIANKTEDIAKSNKLAAIDLSLNESITTIKIKINEIIKAINEGKLKGEDGAPGIDGVDGVDGKDFTFEDFTPEQLEQLRGPQGYRGATGPQGPQGIQGETGATGPQGPQGATGPQGPQGIQGETGATGRDGIDGKQVELQRTQTHIQWRYTEEEWQDLISIDELRAPALQNIDAYTKEETDTLIADAIAQALENVGIMLEDYATKEYVNKQIKALSIVSNKAITKAEVRPEFIKFEENPDAIDRIKLIDYNGNSVAVEILTESKFKFYSNYSDDKCRLYWGSSAIRKNVLYYKYVNGAWKIQNNISGTDSISIYTKKPVDDYLIESTIELSDSSNLSVTFNKKEMVKELVVDYNLATDSPFYTINHDEIVDNAPAIAIKGYLKNEKVGERDLIQTAYDTRGFKTYTRIRTNGIWSDWIDYATTKEINKLIKEPTDILIKALKKNNVEISEDATLTETSNKIYNLLYPVPSLFDNEPENPFGNELHSKIRYKDRDGMYRVIYSKVSSAGYPCFNPTTGILYFATKATFVQGYTYMDGEWEPITETYFGYLQSGEELQSVYSNSADIGYHSTHANFGQTWKAKTNY